MIPPMIPIGMMVVGLISAWIAGMSAIEVGDITKPPDWIETFEKVQLIAGVTAGILIVLSLTLMLGLLDPILFFFHF